MYQIRLYIQAQLNPNNKRRIKYTQRQVILSEGVFFVFISLSQLLFIFEKKIQDLQSVVFFSEFSVVGGQICVFFNTDTKSHIS